MRFQMRSLNGQEMIYKDKMHAEIDPNACIREINPNATMQVDTNTYIATTWDNA